MPISEVNHQLELSSGRLDVVELRHQLDVLVRASESLRAHLEEERDQATRRGDASAARALERGVLQVTRVRNEVSCACHELDPVVAPAPPRYARHAA
ncbi:MAG: hypothetical protein JO057_25625 [Chloroflexi bacterium]|nr:hypothetical protein [Chloroflexota bacterium]